MRAPRLTSSGPTSMSAAGADVAILRDVSVVATLEVGGHIVTLQDPAGGSFNAAGDFDGLLLHAASPPMLGRISEFGDTQFSSEELLAVSAEASGLMGLANDGPELRGMTR